MTDYAKGHEAARKAAAERVKWYRTDLAFRAPELWPTHGDLLDRLVHDMEHLPAGEPDGPEGDREERLSAALDACASCCLDDPEDRERVLAAVIEASRPPKLDVLYDVDDGVVVIGDNIEVRVHDLKHPDEVVEVLRAHGCNLNYTEHK
jgi:hypothetical protein